jgi:hypothetical protein
MRREAQAILIAELNQRIAELEAATANHLLEMQRLADENRVLREQVRWIPVSERLPEMGKTVLIYRVGGVNRHSDIEYALRDKRYNTRREDNIWDWVTSGNQGGRYWGLSVDGSEVTHWMPLPPPPQECQHLVTSQSNDLSAVCLRCKAQIPPPREQKV